MPSLTEPNPWSQPLPEAFPPADLAIYHLPTGTYTTRAALAFKGGSFGDKRQFASSAVLVQHPDGDLLIDAGFGADVAAHIAMLPRFVRAPHQTGLTVSSQLDAIGYDRRRLRGVLPTHSHWDHVSGLDSLHGTPIWMNANERGYAAGDPDGKVYRSVSQGHDIHEYGFDHKPYLGFATSYDVYGDGSVVIALAGGHTTGSVIVFVTLPTAKRYAFIGDLTWQIDGIRRRVERPWLLSKLADSDPEQLRQGLRRVIAVEGHMQIVPAHDLDSYQGIPLLSARAAGQPGQDRTAPTDPALNTGTDTPATTTGK
ncbi:MBL fold metallo-hydrolase [Winogradskya consettensis]|uniref:MBL fold metallo-hydrolase n=1 Tax=Winogradskya consettensis TaxID=113560 RepID=A0A919SMH8_9ACTN|nr:MBL fold metallo-hydrolase [Actinoplanes consettensis]GIM74224.1 MBL fold metallo-hydrolase [Actinoplanes consettensis]